MIQNKNICLFPIFIEKKKNKEDEGKNKEENDHQELFKIGKNKQEAENIMANALEDDNKENILYKKQLELKEKEFKNELQIESLSRNEYEFIQISKNN